MLLFDLLGVELGDETFLYSIFSLVIIIFLLVDLGIFNKDAHKITTRSALIQSMFWVFISTIFGILILFLDKDPESGGTKGAVEYFSAYLTEYALSVDNIFVILLILKYFNVKEEYYHKILFWGILGAVVFRGVFIFVGAMLIHKFHAILYVFGVFLIYSGIKIYFDDSDEKMDPGKNPILRLCRKYLPISETDEGGKFFISKPKLMFTPLFLVIILIETTDLIFAVDSIPAAFAITQNEFLIYTSNIFAVLGLRAMFFMLSGIIDRFHLLQKGLSVILFFIGAKMLLEMFHIEFPPIISFSVIIATLTISIIFSIILPKREPKSQELN